MSNFSNFSESKQTFTTKHNLQLLWDVLLDELNINMTNKNLFNNIQTVFDSNINPFLTKANPKSNIMNLNKEFLSQVVLAVNRLFPNLQKQEQNIKRITITDEEITEPYKIEDIHASRQTDFEKDVELKRIEMENYMIPKKPKELDFSDNNLDGKIKEMDSLIAEKMAQRNLEFDNIQNSNYNIDNIDLEKWLTPKKTSVKNEKNIVEQKSTIKQNDNTRLKHISIDGNTSKSAQHNFEEHDDPSQSIVKKVSWNDEEPLINIFNKLKKQPVLESTQHDINNINVNNEKQYDEQKSIQLPVIKQETIIRKANIIKYFFIFNMT